MPPVSPWAVNAARDARARHAADEVQTTSLASAARRCSAQHAASGPSSPALQPKTMPLLRRLILLAASLLRLSLPAGAACSPKTCGGLNLSYPFWLDEGDGNPPCGSLSFQLRCNGSRALLGCLIFPAHRSLRSWQGQDRRRGPAERDGDAVLERGELLPHPCSACGSAARRARRRPALASVQHARPRASPTARRARRLPAGSATAAS